MLERRGLHTFLGTIGLLAWLLFILGCTGWPSWSPDGTKILAPYVDPNAKQEGIALYDLKTHVARSIFVRPFTSDYDGNSVVAQWESDGKRAIVIWPDEKTFQVALLPVGWGRPARHFYLGNREDDIPLPPFPELGGVLFVGGKQISRLNLKTGEMLSTPFSTVNPQTGESVKTELEVEAYLSTDGSRVYYIRKLEAGDYELGTVDPNELALHPLFKVTSAELEARGFTGAELYPLVAPEPHGSRLAVRVKGKTEDAIALFTQSGLQTVLKPDFGIKDPRIGFPQWAPGGKLLYLCVAALVKEEVAQYWVAEVPIDGGRVRMTKIARFKAESDWDDEFPLSLQVSLSPDGSTLATTTAGLSEKYVAPETKRALYLVNLRDPRRTVTSIPAPISPAPAKAGKEKP